MSTPGDSVLEGSFGKASAAIHRYAWVIVAAGFLVTWVGVGSGRYLYQVIMPAMQDSLGISYAPAGALASAIMIGYLSGCLLSGVLAVRFGSRLLASICTLAVGAAMLGTSVASWYPLVFFLMLVIGLGAGGAYIPVSGLVASWFPPERRGMFMSITTAGANCGILATAVIAPRILDANGGTGWRPSWVYFGLSALAVGIIAIAGLRDGPPGKKEASGPSSAPVAPRWGAVFQNRSILGLTAAYLCHGFFSIYLVFLSAFATRGLGYSPGVAGNLWTLLGVVSVLTMVPWGYLSDRFGRKQAVIPCAAILLTGIAIPVFRQDIPSLVVSAMLFGFAYVGPMMIITVAAGDIAGPTMAAPAMGLVTMGHGIGQMIGPAIGGAIIDWSGSFYPGFILSAAGILGEIIIVSRLTIPRAKHGPGN